MAWGSISGSSTDHCAQGGEPFLRRLPGSHMGTIDGLAGLFWAVNQRR